MKGVLDDPINTVIKKIDQTAVRQFVFPTQYLTTLRTELRHLPKYGKEWHVDLASLVRNLQGQEL